MSDTGILDLQRIRSAHKAASTGDGALAVALGAIITIIGLGTVAAGIWLAYGSTETVLHLPGGLASADTGVVSIYLVACGALTTVLGAFSIYEAQDM